MTCIVGLVEGDKVYIGGDSAGVAGYDMQLRADEKVFTNNEFIMGFTSSFRMGQILRYDFNPPDRYEKITDDTYLYKYWINSVIETMKTKGYATVKEGKVAGGTFIFGYRKKLYTVENDFQIGKMIKPYIAVGCGDKYALGALYILEGIKKSPKDKVLLALRAAEDRSAGVRGPFHIVEL